MSDAPSPIIEKVESSAPAAAAAENSDVAEVLMEQVDQKVGAIEQEQTRMAPFQAALATAQGDVSKLQASAQAATDADVKKVYEHAIQVALEIIAEIKKGGEGVADRIKALQTELRDLLAQLAEKDPNNPLIKQM